LAHVGRRGSRLHVRYRECTDAGKNVIASPNAPAPVGPYSQAIKVGKTVYLSGQIAIDPKTKQLIADASIEDQTRRVLET
jgi:2-iminobutanoate/2-iminopropanoate deaminase